MADSGPYSCAAFGQHILLKTNGSPCNVDVPSSDLSTVHEMLTGILGTHHAHIALCDVLGYTT